MDVALLKSFLRWQRRLNMFSSMLAARNGIMLEYEFPKFVIVWRCSDPILAKSSILLNRKMGFQMDSSIAALAAFADIPQCRSRNGHIFPHA